MVGKEKGQNPGGGEFPDGLGLHKKLQQFLLIGLEGPRPSLPDRQSRNSLRLGSGKENEFLPNCHFGERSSRTPSAWRKQKSISEIS